VYTCRALAQDDVGRPGFCERVGIDGRESEQGIIAAYTEQQNAVDGDVHLLRGWNGDYPDTDQHRESHPHDLTVHGLPPSSGLNAMDSTEMNSSLASCCVSDPMIGCTAFHLAYEFLMDTSGTGFDVLYTPEITTAAATMTNSFAAGGRCISGRYGILNFLIL
jgi:hypothetical protein